MSKRRLGAVLGIALALSGWAANQPANADCVEADVWVTWASGDPPTYVTPWTAGHCVVPTSFPTFAEPHTGYTDPTTSAPLPRSVEARGSLVWPLP